MATMKNRAAMIIRLRVLLSFIRVKIGAKKFISKKNGSKFPKKIQNFFSMVLFALLEKMGYIRRYK